MTEDNYAIGDYIAVLNNLDDYDNVTDCEWPSLTTPMPVVQTSDSISSPTSQQSCPDKEVETLEDSLTYKTAISPPNDNHVQQATKMVVARQIDLSVQTTIKLVPDVTSCAGPSDHPGCISTYSSFRDSPLQMSPTYSTVDNLHFGAEPFITPDSAFATPGDNGFNDSQITVPNANYEENINETLTPRSVKRRHRAMYFNMPPDKSSEYDTELSSFDKTFQCSSDLQDSGVNYLPNCSNIPFMQPNDSGIGCSFMSEKNDASELEDKVQEETTGNSTTVVDGNKSTATGRRKRRAKIVRPNEEEFQEKIAAKLVGRLVIRQSIPKYRITYSELLRRVGPPELFNVSALITLFRIKKDAESSFRIMSVLKDAGYQLKKGRRMNRDITRFSSFAEEEAVETGRDVGRIAKAFVPLQPSSTLFFQKLKTCQPANVLMTRIQCLPMFYSVAKSIIESDQTPLAFNRLPEGAVLLSTELQEILGHLTWITHGFTKSAYAGLTELLRYIAEFNLSYVQQNSENGDATVPSSETFTDQANDNDAPLPVSTTSTCYWKPFMDDQGEYNTAVNVDHCYQTDYQNHLMYRGTCDGETSYSVDDGYNPAIYNTDNFDAVEPNQWTCYDGQQGYPDLQNGGFDDKMEQRPSCTYYS